jgi:hypothetical protein
MESFAGKVTAGLLITASLFLVVIFGTLLGAVTGYIVGLFFTPTLTHVMEALGIHDVAVWQLGAFLGFTGPFLRTSVTTTKD